MKYQTLKILSVVAVGGIAGPGCRERPPSTAKSLKSPALWAASLLAALVLTGCGDSGPDYGPIGDGMKAIGICLVVATVVAALADLVKSEQDRENPPAPKHERKRKTANRKEDTK